MKLALLIGNRFNPWHLEGFKRLRGAPEVVCFRADSEIQRYFMERGGDVLSLPAEPIYFDTQAGPPWARLRNELMTRYFGREPRILPFHDRLQGYDIIQSWELFTDWSSEAEMARRRCGVPLCVMVWDNIPFNMERNPGRREVKERVARAADRLIVHTERSRRMLDIEGVASRRVIKIDPGVDTEQFSPGPSMRERFGLSDEDFVILFVGWFLPRKGLDFLLLALREILNDAALAKRRPRLLVVGSGPGRDRVDALVGRLGIGSACTFAGSLTYAEMPQAFRAADAFVLPSIATPEWQEQFGMAIIEAMATGTPVVSTLSGAIPEITGGAAMLCQPNDFVSLYEALKELMIEPAKRRELSARGRDRALERFSLEGYAEALSSVYADVLSNGK